MSRSCPVGHDIQLATRILREGGLVAIGTETVYGLGAHARDLRAVANIFEVKQRPTFDPLIVHVDHRESVQGVASEWNDLAEQLAMHFWPGPLTLIVPKKNDIPDLVTASRSTVAVRVPGSVRTRQLLEEVGLPIAAPSANPFGQISPTTAQHVVDQLGDQIDYVFDTGPCSVGIESTVVDVSDGVPWLLRPGGVSLEDLESVIGALQVVTKSELGSQRAPGLLSKHYAPTSPLRIVEHPRPNEQRIGLLSFGPYPSQESFAAVEILSLHHDLVEATANFFAALRRLDTLNLDEIWATPFPQRGLGRALNDRLQRAAAKS